MSKKPLDGVRILELAIYGAVPITARQLAQLGAEVIRIETNKAPDQVRIFPSPRIPGATWPEFGSGKRSITLDIQTRKGQEIFARLVKISDVLTTNWPERILSEWGADYEAVKAINPKIIVLWGTACGSTGPYARYRAYGATLQAVCGIMDLSGVPGGPPTMQASAYCDYHAPVYSATLIVGALEYVRQTGKGMLIEVPLFETGVSNLGPPILEYMVNERIVSHVGNRHYFLAAAPHGIYPCKGEDCWCAIAVFTEEEWQSFCRVIGDPKWTKDPKFATLVNRLKNQDELDRLIGEWTKNLSAEEVMEVMQKNGVPAGLVAKGQDLVESPHLTHRGFYRETEYYPYPGTADVEETRPTLVSSIPIRLSEADTSPLPIRKMGADNDYVYGDLLGMSQDEISRLTEEGVLV